MPAIKITRAELAALEPCYLYERLQLFGRRKYLTASQALEAGATIEDILWVAGRLGLGVKCVEFAEACVKRVEHLRDASPRSPEARAKIRLQVNRAAGYAANAGRYAGHGNTIYAAKEAQWAASAAQVAVYWSVRVMGDPAPAVAGQGAEYEAQEALIKEIFG